ncbi:hypothetical protein [Gloeobacter kilaueensis]|uniref:hypothetical protein n=1 Tax=Gloeobacter kilaueensis TaxID=1416614 RepID=UPI001651B134|nr:hypothetical protein [Gloeobacter kilaueensis]
MKEFDFGMARQARIWLNELPAVTYDYKITKWKTFYNMLCLHQHQTGKMKY